MKKLFILYFVLAIGFTKIFAGGTVVLDSLYSTSLNAYKKFNIYLPDGYNPNGTTLYSVIYFLHGATLNHNSYGYIYSILDNLIANQLIQPLILVKPDGTSPPFQGSFYTNSILYGNYENYIYMDLVQHIDTHFKTNTSRNKRSIMGHSMGGYGAMALALKHSNLYRAVASHSGALDLYHVSELIPYIIQESGSGPPYTYYPGAGFFSGFTFTMSGAFSPNMNNPPYNVDFLLNSSGMIIDSIFNKWKPHNPVRLTSNINNSSNLAIYFDCGEQDQLTFWGWNNAFNDTLEERGISFKYLSYEGNHSGQLPNRFPISLRFLDSAMNAVIGIQPVSNEIPAGFSLSQNYPNPFNPTTKIDFMVPKTSHVTLKIYDIKGHEVYKLVDQKLIAGTYTVDWNSTQKSGEYVASGVYFYKMTGDNFSVTKKMMLVR